MTQKECDFLIEVSNLASKCPAPSPNPYDLIGYIHACRDYEKILTCISNALQFYAFYSSMKNRPHNEDDEEYVESCKEKAETYFAELQEFVQKRVKEGWA